jgi:O-antigen ligase
MRKFLRFSEQAFTVVSLILYSGGPLAVILAGGANEGEVEGGSVQVDSSLILLLFFVNYIVVCFLLVIRWKKVLHLLSKDKFIWVLIGIAVVSFVWSTNPSKTISRIIALSGTSLFGLYLATRYSIRQQIQLLAWMFGIAVVLSFVFAVALPKYGIMGGLHAGKWRGIYTHKNVLGKMMVPSIMSFLLLAIDARKKRWLLWGGVSLSVLLLLLSTSKTSLVNLITVLAAFGIYGTFRWRYHRMLPALITITTVGIALRLWLSANAEVLLGAMGKDTSLTGRGDLWPLVLNAIGQRPWLGYGFGAFWNGLQSEASVIWYAASWPVPNSHNGFLDLLINLGILGLSVFVIGFLACILRSLVWVRLSKTADGFWPMLYLTYLVLANLAESSLMIQNDLFWVLYVAVAFSVLLPPEGETKAVDRKHNQSSFNAALVEQSFN